MRERSTSVADDPVPTRLYTTSRLGSCSNPSGTETEATAYESQNVAFSSSAVMHDVVTPNFHECVRRGEIINNPMDRAVTTETSKVANVYGPVHLRHWDTSCDPDQYITRMRIWQGTLPSFQWWSNIGGGWPAAPSIGIESLKAQAVHKAHARQELSSFQAAVFLGELSESILSLKSAFQGILKILKKAKTGRWRVTEKTHANTGELLDATEKWMYVRYAIRPLVYDVLSCIETLNAKAKSVGERFTSRGYVEKNSSSQTDYEWNGTTVLDGHNFYDEMTMRLNDVYSVEVRAGVLAQIEAIHWLNTWGFDQVLETGWELVSRSFVADWFLDIGTTIAALTPEYGLRQLASWVVVKTSHISNVEMLKYCRTPQTVLENWSDMGSFRTVSNFGCKRVKTTYDRTPNPILSPFPRFRINLDWMKCTDLAIIAGQTLRRM